MGFNHTTLTNILMLSITNMLENKNGFGGACVLWWWWF
jgi:hypothetical protein